MEVLPPSSGYTLTLDNSRLCFGSAGSREPKGSGHARLWAQPGPLRGPGDPRPPWPAASPRMVPRAGRQAQRGSHDLRFGQSQGPQESPRRLRNNCDPFKTKHGTRASTEVSQQSPGRPHVTVRSRTATTRCPPLNQVPHAKPPRDPQAEKRDSRGEGAVVLQLGPGPPGGRRKGRGGWRPQGTK